MSKNVSSFTILGLLVTVGVWLNMPSIESFTSQLKTSTVTSQIRPVAEVGRYVDDLPAVNGYKLTALNQSPDYVCIKAVELSTRTTYYYDTDTRVAGPSTCKKG